MGCFFNGGILFFCLSNSEICFSSGNIVGRRGITYRGRLGEGL